MKHDNGNTKASLKSGVRSHMLRTPDLTVARDAHRRRCRRYNSALDRCLAPARAHPDFADGELLSTDHEGNKFEVRLGSDHRVELVLKDDLAGDTDAAMDEGAAAPFTPLTDGVLPEFPTPGNRRPWEQVPKMHRDPLALEPGSRSPAGRLTPGIICRALSARHPLRGQHAERDGHGAHAHRALHKGREQLRRL